MPRWTHWCRLLWNFGIQSIEVILGTVCLHHSPGPVCWQLQWTNERFTLGGGEVVQRGAHPEPSATNTIPPFTPTPPHHLSASSTRLNTSKQQLHKHSTAFTFIHQGRTVTDLSISIWGAWCKKLVGCRQTFWTSRPKQMPNLHTRQPRALCKWLEEAFVYFQNFTPGNNKPKKCTD